MGKCYPCGCLYAHPKCAPCSWYAARLPQAEICPKGEGTIHLIQTCNSIYCIWSFNVHLYSIVHLCLRMSLHVQHAQSLATNPTTCITYHLQPIPLSKNKKRRSEPQKVNHSPARSARPDTSKNFRSDDDDECLEHITCEMFDQCMWYVASTKTCLSYCVWTRKSRL